MTFTILSLNVHIWVRDLNPFKWHQFWLPRTIKMIRLFRREKPDVICLQERIYPLGKVLLGLWGYMALMSRKSRIPIYVKRSFLRKNGFNAKMAFEYAGTAKDNGHGISTTMLWQDKWYLYIVNCHHSFDRQTLMREIRHELSNALVCGDLNCERPRYADIWTQVKKGRIWFVPKEPTNAPTYHCFDKPEETRDIDHFYFTTSNEASPFKYFKISCKVLPDDLSDHYPILAEVEI